MPLTLFNTISGRDKDKSLTKLISYSLPDQDLILMAILSIIMANLGFLLNNMAVLIGSMLIAPIIYPIMSCGMSFVVLDIKLFIRSLGTISIFAILGITASLLVTFLFSSYPVDFTNDLIAHMQPSWLYFAVAFVAGLAASFALVKPELNEMFPGIAVAVALIPPLAVIGIGLAENESVIVTDAVHLFLSNAGGIILASLIIFTFMRFRLKKRVAKKVLAQEEKELENGIK
ncbi:DUF389 domain-containing protein [Patescibacteria group bacterium]|nr:DUF389 domain-containing protein [Patescibacteria group bacterium]